MKLWHFSTNCILVYCDQIINSSYFWKRKQEMKTKEKGERV